MKKYFCILKKLLCIAAFCASIGVSEKVVAQVSLEAMTEQWLLENDGESKEFIPFFREILTQFQGSTVLQLGIGPVTKYLLDHAKKVVSVEFLSQGNSPDLAKHWIAKYKGLSHWIPIIYFSKYQGDSTWAFFKYFGSDSLFKASYHRMMYHQSYATVDPSFFEEIGSFFGHLIKLNKFLCAHVASSMYIRGEMIQFFFGKVPIIFAEDAASRVTGGIDFYGYQELVTPDDYEEIHLAKRAVVWVSKDEKYQQLIANLKMLRQ